jgi:hypothetical protein
MMGLVEEVILHSIKETILAEMRVVEATLEWIYLLVLETQIVGQRLFLLEMASLPLPVGMEDGAEASSFDMMMCLLQPDRVVLIMVELFLSLIAICRP